MVKTGLTQISFLKILFEN